jgi:5'-nucleotidase
MGAKTDLTSGPESSPSAPKSAADALEPLRRPPPARPPPRRHGRFPGAALQLSTLPRASRVYVNRSLRMEHVEWVGFDMDYTLAIYNQEEMDRLSIEATVKKLVERGYPPVLAEATSRSTSHPRAAHRQEARHILKMDRYKYVRPGWHGMRELTIARSCARALPRPQGPPRRAALPLDRHPLRAPEAAIYAGAVDLLDRYGMQRRLRDSSSRHPRVHRRGPPRRHHPRRHRPRPAALRRRDPDLAPTLHKLRSAGKRLFC